MSDQAEEHFFVKLARQLREKGDATWHVSAPGESMQLNLLLSPGQKTGQKLLRGSVVTGKYHTATYTLTSVMIVQATNTDHDIASMIQLVVEELFFSIEEHMKEAAIFRDIVGPVVRQ